MKNTHPHHTRYAYLVSAFAALAFSLMTQVSLQHALVIAQLSSK